MYKEGPKKKKNPNFFLSKSTQNPLEAELGFNEMKAQNGLSPTGALGGYWVTWGLVTLSRITSF